MTERAVGLQAVLQNLAVRKDAKKASTKRKTNRNHFPKSTAEEGGDSFYTGPHKAEFFR